MERRQNGGVMEVGTVEKRTDDNMEVVEEVQVNDLNGRLQNLVERRTELKEREEQEIMEEQETENEDEEAVKVQGTARSSKSSGEERENVENSREEYDVEQILAKKKLNNKNLYLVKWKGFEEEQDRTWEPAKAFTGELAKKLYRKFNAEQRKRIGGEFCRKNVEAEDFHAEVEQETVKQVKGVSKKRSLNVTEDDEILQSKLKKRRITMPGGTQNKGISLQDVGARETAKVSGGRSQIFTFHIQIIIT